MEKGYALITGASQGLGRAFALDLAGRGHGVIVVARSLDKLDAVAKACATMNGGRAKAIGVDLAAPGAVAELVAQVEALGLPIEVLVNNAGEAIWGFFQDKPLEDHQRMMRLNMAVPVELTYRMLPSLRAQRRSYILNVGSMTGYNAVATLGTYSGSKAFILRWSRSLRLEMKGSGLQVCCVCPGSVITGFTERAGMQVMDDLAKKFGKPPEPIAKAALNALFKGRAEVVPGSLDSSTAWIMRQLPSGLVERIASGIYLKRLPARGQRREV